MKYPKFEVGETVMTIQGPRKIIRITKDCLIFEEGKAFAPKDRVTRMKGIELCIK